MYLSKREKVFSIIYGFLLLCLFIAFGALTTRGTSLGKSLTFYSSPLQAFLSVSSIFASIYFGMTFVSTLFHLPTAEAFDRKMSEVSSLHNLSRLVTQVFDFNELVDSVTTMTLDVCEAKSSWLEILTSPGSKTGSRKLPADSSQNLLAETVGLKNISREAVDAMMQLDGHSLRKLASESRKPIVIDEVKRDKRTKHLGDMKETIGSLVVVPLVSHESVIGILYATKDMEFGFDREDVELISAFADQATIAIENSRLIEKSIERERLLREMMLAQEMQKRLLPQELPKLEDVDLDAISSPAFEVGGDYYDFTMLDDRRLGILVGDVSGKGVSAAFYMAELKGIFQSLGKIYPSPHVFLSKAHDALVGTIDKRSFISLIYAVLELDTGAMTVSRAGHCPMLFVSRGKARYVRPTGLGLGMGNSELFQRTIAQEQVRFSPGDFAVFYTDGLTEARPKNGMEFGYEKLMEIVQSVDTLTAEQIRDTIIMAVDEHMNHEPPEDDMTIVVLKWKK